jgi:hypothetical protein
MTRHEYATTQHSTAQHAQTSKDSNRLRYMTAEHSTTDTETNTDT